MNTSLSFRRVLPLIIASVLVAGLVLCVKLPAQTVSPRSADELVRQYRDVSLSEISMMTPDQYDQYMTAFASVYRYQEDARQRHVSDDVMGDKCSGQCRTFDMAFNAPIVGRIIPDALMVYRSDGSLVGGFTYHDFDIHGHIRFQLPVGEYTFVMKHGRDHDVVMDRISVTDDNVDDMYGDNEDPMGVSLSDVPAISEIPYVPVPYGFDSFGGMYNFSIEVRDVYTNEPLSGVTVYTNDGMLLGTSNERGVVRGMVSCPNESQFSIGSNGVAECPVRVYYHRDGYHDGYGQITVAKGNDPGRMHYDYWYMDRLIPYTSAPIRTIRLIKNQADLSFGRTYACTLPSTIRVGINCGAGAGTCQSVITCDFNRYIRATLHHEWNVAGFAPAPYSVEAFKAGATAIRTTAWYYVSNPVSGAYDVCNSTYCQVLNIATYNATATQSLPGDPAVTATDGWVLRNATNTAIQKAEYSAETNNLGLASGCGDGYFKRSFTASNSCYPAYGVERVGLGYAVDGHGRGMSQRGSVRWASGIRVNANNTLSTGVSILPNTYQGIGYCKKGWIHIVGHYYPYYKLEKCTTGSVILSGQFSQKCMPNLTHWAISMSQSGNTLTWNHSVVNNGLATSGPFVIKYYLSPDNVFDANDVLFRTLTSSNTTLSAYTKTWSGVSVNVSGLVPAGTYYVIFRIDANNQVTEGNESDNNYYLTQTYSVSTAPVRISAQEYQIDSYDEDVVDVSAGGDDVVSASLQEGALSCVEWMSFHAHEGGATITCNDPGDLTIFDMMGRRLYQYDRVSTIDVPLASGYYVAFRNGCKSMMFGVW